MIKKISLYTLSILLMSCFFGSSLSFTEKDIEGKENLLINGSFELGDYNANSNPEGWMVMNNDVKNQIVWDEKISLDGKYSLRFSQTADAINLISENFEINPQNAYFFKAGIKADEINKSEVIFMLVTFDDFSHKTNIFRKKVVPTKEWETISLSAGFFKNSTKFGRIIITIPQNSKKTIWLDDLGIYNVYKFRTIN